MTPPAPCARRPFGRLPVIPAGHRAERRS